jgi:hypothetical protein
MPSGRLLALVILLVEPAAAQHYANLYGRILDATEGGIGMAAVTVVNEDTGFRRTTTSEPTGVYAVSSLVPGSYKITVRREGFVSVVQFGVKLLPGGSTRADFIMPVGSVEESITVVGTAPLVAQEDASTGSRIDRDEMDRLPLNGGGVLNLLEFAPGTIVVPATRGEAGQFTATGQRPNTNYFTVDGLSANTGITAGGLPAQSTGGSLPALSAFGSMDSLISMEAVQEFRVTTSTSVAEFGRLPGAAVALTSRSGSNELHGSTLYRIRNEMLSANDWFGNQAGYGLMPLRLENITQTLGGPVKRNRTFFFFSYEHTAMRQPFIWQQTVPTLAARQSAADWAQPLLNLFPAPNGSTPAGNIGVWTGGNVRPAALTTGGARIDQAIGSRVMLFGRYNDSPSLNEFGTLVVNRLDLRSRSATLGLNARITANTVLDLRANESQVEAHSIWSQGDPCALQPLTASFLGDGATCDYLVRFSIGGVGQLVSGREGDRRQRQFQLLPMVSRWQGRHSLGIGMDYRRMVAVRRDPTGALGVIADSLADLADDKRNLWISRAPAVNATVGLPEYSAWIQDTWQATRRLTVAAGLRWEFSPAPVPADDTYFLNLTTNTVFGMRQPLWPTNYHNFAPRLGIAVRLSRDGSTVLRMGGGLYYDSSMSIATDVLNGGPLSIASFSSGIYSPFPAQLTFGFMPFLRLPEIKQWNVSLEHAFSARDVLSLGYVGSAGRDLVLREVGGAGSSLTSWLALTTNYGRSDYHALHLEYRRNVARGLQAHVAYAWSHSIDNDSSDAFLLWGGSGVSDRGSSDFDLRHSFTGSVSYEVPRLHGLALDAIFRARTGFPITVQQTEEYFGISLSNAFRPDWVYGQPFWLTDPSAPGGRVLNPAAFQNTKAGVQGDLGRNVVSGFGMSQLDLAVRKEFRLADRKLLQVRIEAFNALNQANFGDPVKYLNSPLFGRSTSMLNMMLGTGSPGSGLAPILQTGGPRSLQGVLRFQF